MAKRKDKKIVFTYDHEADVLYCHINRPVSALGYEEQDGVFIRRAIDTNQVVGFTIVDYKKRKKRGLIKEIPHFEGIKIPY